MRETTSTPTRSVNFCRTDSKEESDTLAGWKCAGWNYYVVSSVWFYYWWVNRTNILCKITLILASPLAKAAVPSTTCGCMSPFGSTRCCRESCLWWGLQIMVWDNPRERDNKRWQRQLLKQKRKRRRRIGLDYQVLLSSTLTLYCDSYLAPANRVFDFIRRIA